MNPYFLHEVLIEVHKLDASNFQSLANYAGSRALAAASTLLLRISMMEAKEMGAYKEALHNEIVSRIPSTKAHANDTRASHALTNTAREQLLVSLALASWFTQTDFERPRS